MLPVRAEIIVVELGSTDAEAMLVFQRLDAGNGTKPLRLAPLPVLMPEHCDWVGGGGGGGAAAPLTVILKVAVCVSGGALESVTVTPKLVFPAAVGVPVISPALESDNPAGRLLLEASAHE